MIGIDIEGASLSIPIILESYGIANRLSFQRFG